MWRRASEITVWGLWAMSSIVFIFLDFLDSILCIFYRIADEFLEGKASPCYCQNKGERVEASETLFGRKNVFREMGFPGISRKCVGPNSNSNSNKGGGGGGGGGGETERVLRNRWSDCGCEACLSWMNNVDQRLHVVVRQPSKATIEDYKGMEAENVIFIHGFLSSSLFWTETVFPNISDSTKRNYRLFAVDLLGFGSSPKPIDCFYTLKDHLKMIEKSVLCPFELNSFHLVAHSMGCIVALALAAKNSKSVKSITLIAPPYFPSSKDDSSLTALTRLADRRLWPPLLFASSVMSWYEHLGRCVCFLVCRNHRTWEWILRFLTRRSDLHFTIIDMSRHTHHSAWHTMHNVICGGAKLMDEYLEVLKNSSVRIIVIQGRRDRVVPLECSNNIKLKVPKAEVNIITNANHNTVLLGREKAFTMDLERVWACCCLQNGST